MQCFALVIVSSDGRKAVSLRKGVLEMENNSYLIIGIVFGRGRALGGRLPRTLRLRHVRITLRYAYRQIGAFTGGQRKKPRKNQR